MFADGLSQSSPTTHTDNHEHFSTDGNKDTNPIATEPISTDTSQQRKGSIFAAKGQEKDTFAALTENISGECVATLLIRLSFSD